MVICGFSGIGKSTLSHRDIRVFDFESSRYSHIYECGVKMGINSEFPKNYIDALENMMSQNAAGYYYLVSCHESVRQELTNRGIPYVIVAPYWECKNEYLKRWLRRGSSVEFIQNMYDRWDEMQHSCVNDGAAIIYLDEKEYISDIIKI